MRIFSRVTILALFAAACSLGAASAAGNTTSSHPVLLNNLAGTWSCTSNMPDGTRHGTTTWIHTDSGWFQGTSSRSAYANTPANSGVSLMGYDAGKGQYVSMGANSMGGYGVSTAKAAPTARVFTFERGYPADPMHGKTTYHISGSTLTFTSTWTQKGKRLSSHGTCTKQ